MTGSQDLTSRDFGGSRMNQDIFKGKWKEMRGLVKEWWGKLTDDELEQAGGNADQIVGLLQQKYGYTREHAEEEFNRRVKELKDATRPS
jgi:uncharacterized protein YjbJ (UPF0337 family)